MEGQCNCAFEMSTTRRVPTYQASVGAATAKDIPLVDNVEVSIPVLTNTKDISVGQELVVFCKKTVKSVAAPKTEGVAGRRCAGVSQVNEDQQRLRVAPAAAGVGQF